MLPMLRSGSPGWALSARISSVGPRVASWALVQVSGPAKVVENTSLGRLFICSASGPGEDGQDDAMIS